MGDGLWSVLESVPVPRGSIKDVCMRSECACKCGRREMKEREGEEGNIRKFYLFIPTCTISTYLDKFLNITRSGFSQCYTIFIRD